MKRIRVIYVLEISGIEYAVHFNQEGGGWNVHVCKQEVGDVGYEMFLADTNTPTINDAVWYLETILEVAQANA